MTAGLEDPGYYLIGAGRRVFEKGIGFRPSWRSLPARLNARLGVGLYVGAILALTAVILAVVVATLSAASLGIAWLILLAVLALLPATEAATAFVNRAVSDIFGARLLPGLELADGVPEHLRTMVVMPTLMTDEASLHEDIERLEVHYLASVGGELHFALLLDGVDCRPGDGAGRRPPSDARRRRHNAAEPHPRPGAERRPLLPFPSSPRLRARRRPLDGMGAQTRQAARAEPASARRDRYDI